MTALPENEFARPLIAHEIGAVARHERISATADERAALCQRFDLLALDALMADLVVKRTAEGLSVKGRLAASGAQPCVVSGAPVPFALESPVELLYVAPDSQDGDEEMELDAGDLDIVVLDGDRLDIGEAVAQSLSLILEPYPRASEADLAAARRRLMSEEEAAARAAEEKATSSPFQALRSAADGPKSR